MVNRLLISMYRGETLGMISKTSPKQSFNSHTVSILLYKLGVIHYFNKSPSRFTFISPVYFVFYNSKSSH